MIRTYKYRLYPTKAQTRQLTFLLDQARYLYNQALEQRITNSREKGKGISYPQQWAHFRDQRRAQPDTLGQLNATSVQQLLRRLDKAFSAFFRRLKAGETPGFPRFKGRDRFNSLEYRYGDGCKMRVGPRMMLYIQNVGEIKVKYHRAAQRRGHQARGHQASQPHVVRLPDARLARSGRGRTSWSSSRDRHGALQPAGAE